MNWLYKTFARFKLATAWYAEEIHFLLAYATVITFRTWWAFLLVLAWALWVELYFDPRFERQETKVRMEDIEDIVFYVVGAGAALLMLWLVRFI